MIRTVKKIGILFGIFVLAVLVYFIWNRGRMNQTDTTYTALEDARLPVVYVSMYGREMNPMHGYCQDMGNAVARERLTVLPEDRALPIHVAHGTGAVLAVRYEIRSLDLQRLVENTELETWETEEDGIRAVLPIQNLLTRDREYLLRIEVDTEAMGTACYYTRIVWTENDTARSLISLAADFSDRTFDYNRAQTLTTYMEPSDQEDNSSYGHTTIHSNFSQLTWGDLNMKPFGEVQLTLKELDGIMGCVGLSYVASRTGLTGEEYYQVEENFTMKWNERRTYLMDYDRTVDQIVEGSAGDYSGRRIILGITNEDRLSVKKSPDGNVIGYRVNRDLWTYDQQERRAVRVFSFRGNDRQDIRNNYDRHDIRILDVTDEGDVEFLVYGYQNRGSREGRFGVVGYRYDSGEHALEENFYIPVSVSYEELEADINQLAYRSQSEMLYLYLNHAIFGIDLTSNETMVVADALEEGSYAVSAGRDRIAWQEGGRRYEAGTLHVLDLETGQSWEIRGGEGEVVRPLGFVSSDLVYGVARASDRWTVNGRIEGLPMYAVEIVNDGMVTETRYEKEGYYVADVKVEESRIHLNRVTRLGDHSYMPAQEDTIVCNVDMGPGALEGIGWFASQERRRLYFVQLDQELRGGRGVRVSAPRRIRFEESDVLELKSNFQVQGLWFYAYGGGRLQGITSDFSRAMAMAYDRMGIVVDQNQQILWSRVNRRDSRELREPLTAFAQLERHLDGFSASRSFNDGITLLDARGCGMMQMLYFIDQGIPVLAYTGEGSYLLLCGYDTFNVTVYDPSTREMRKVGLNDSTFYFENLDNDFVCAISQE